MSNLPIISTTTPSKTPIDLSIVGVFANDTSKNAKILKKKFHFDGTLFSLELLKSIDQPALLVLGLGPMDAFTTEKARKLGALCFQTVQAPCFKNLHIITHPWLSDAFTLHAFLEGLFLASSKIKSYQTTNKKIEAPAQHFFLSHPQPKNTKSVIEKVTAFAHAVLLTQQWSNEPANIGTAAYYGKTIQQECKKRGLKCTLINKKEQQRQKMGMFLGVNQGSQEEGVIAVIEYKPKNAKKSIGLVGKGVTFDSGGISLKPPARMEEMKHDMTGAATVVAATFAAAELKSPHRIVTIAAFTDNLPGGRAQTPSNVVHARSGKTVEILNTDAEGRLILGDALDLIQDYKVDTIIDVATLTGAVGIALGKVCAGISGNSQKLIHALEKAAQATDERIWQLPLYEEYSDALKSDVADIKNISNDGQAGTIVAAAFLKAFIKNNTPWAHLDIAATAYNVSHLPYIPKKGASGLFVRMLCAYLLEP